jgi:glycosyltransferase involved in cell wall biosynthesis
MIKIDQKEPLVSVVIPTFNMGEFISDAIVSVIQQSFKNIEIIVVDDGSIDDTDKIVKKLIKQTDIRYIYQKNKGVSAARNTGIQLSKGEFIAFLDSDDYWEPTKLEKQLLIFKTIPDVDVVYCKFHKVDSTGNPLPDSVQSLPPPSDLYKALLFGNIIYGSCSAVIVRKNILQEVGGFDSDLYIGEDQELWQRLAYRNKFHCIDEYLVYIRTHNKSAQANREYFEKGQLLFLNKLKVTVSPEYQHLLSQIAYDKYIDFMRTYSYEHNYQKLFKFFRLVFVLGPKYFVRFLLFITKSILIRTFMGLKKICRKIVYSQKPLRTIYLSQRNKKIIDDWKNKGKPLPAPPVIKQEIVLNFLKKRHPKIFVETGTFLGDMVEATRYDFKHIYSIELSKDLCTAVKVRFMGAKNITILNGDSSKTLMKLMPDLREPCVFWLDAHYSEGITARGEKETPIAEELEVISHHSCREKDIILIDDAREFGKGDYPPIIWIKEWSEKQGFNTFEVDFDIIRIYNKH